MALVQINHLQRNLKTIKVCPSCKTRFKKEDKNEVDCPKCGIIINFSNDNSIRCGICKKLYSDIISYNDHIICCKKIKNKEIANKEEIRIIRGDTP